VSAASPQREPGRAVICVDGIVTALFKKITPDISWEAYVDWLEERRPELDVVYLSQPHDWFEILSRRASTYEDLIQSMVDELMQRLNPRWDQVLILGFSLGGLTALRVAHEVARRAEGLSLDYVAYVTMGSPFGGTGRLLDRLFRLLPFDYFHQMFDIETNRRLIRELLLFARRGKLRIMIGSIERDEIVAPASALLPLEWLKEWDPKGDFKCDTFSVRNHGALIRAHDGLLYDTQSVAFIDGLVDGLLPPTQPLEYQPFRWRERRKRLRRKHATPAAVVEGTYVSTDIV
jgi:pimeloyl-ACP methyl ester carboxylesterase